MSDFEELYEAIRRLYLEASVRAAYFPALEEAAWPGDTQYNGGEEEAAAAAMKAAGETWAEIALELREVLATSSAGFGGLYTLPSLDELLAKPKEER